MVKNLVVEPSVENKVSKVKVSVEKLIPEVVLNCSFLQAVVNAKRKKAATKTSNRKNRKFIIQR